MIIFHKSGDLHAFLTAERNKGTRIGFVPTMGALHQGHLSLIHTALSMNDMVVCSIFINPTQFNNPTDYEKYPVTINNDIALLEQAGCDVLFIPNIEEIYPDGYSQKQYLVDGLDTILEGASRPGHFQGVCMVIDRFIKLVPCRQLILGEKDYQQCLVIKTMFENCSIQTELKICSTMREADGLAMSSRNMRLTETERASANQIYKTLIWLKSNLNTLPIHELIQSAKSQLLAVGFKPDYVAITDEKLNPVEQIDSNMQVRGLIAANLNEIRLIDNLLLQGSSQINTN
jgi:pantoate--beta-alanine ligase